MKMSFLFPGVDPFLEFQGYWPDFHASFITYWRDALIDVLPDHYDARMNERVQLVEIDPDRSKRIGPDVVVTTRQTETPPVHSASAVATLEPVSVLLPLEEEVRETYIEIIHRPDQSLVAVLELLSPANKEEPGRSTHLEKRRAVLQQRTHLLKLDLLFGGRRPPLRDPLPTGDFYALLSRSDNRPHCDVYAWTVRDPLPRLPVPLLAPDDDVWFELSDVFSYTFKKGGYDRCLDYQSAVPSYVAAATRNWIGELISENHEDE